MNKYYLLTIMAVVLALMPARAAIYMVGNIPFGNWNPANGVEMTNQGNGTYTYTVIGKGNFTGSASATLTVKPDTIISAELEQDSFEYDGKAKTVAVKNAAGLHST